MRKIFLTFAMLLAMTGAMAQNSNGDGRQQIRPRNAEEMTTMMESKLSLSATQLSKVKKLNEKYADLFKGKGPAPGSGPGMPPEANNNSTNQNQRQEPPQLSDSQRKQMESEMSARKEKQEAYEKELKKILSSDQYTSYKKMMPQRPGKRPEK